MFKKILATASLLFFPMLLMAQKTIYVANNGNNANNGLSEAAPIQTISHLNTLSFSAGDKILFKKGDVFTGQVEVKSSGTSASPISYGSYGTGTIPVISGGQKLNPLHSSGNVFEASVSEPVLAVYINENKAPLARQPNSGFYTIQSGGKKMVTDGTNLNKATDYYKGANVRIRSSNFTFEARQITSSSSNSVYWAADLHYNANPGYGYFLDNHRDFLDAQDEWYYDAANNKVLLYSSSAPANCYASIHEYGLKFGTNVSHIVVDGLAFNYQFLDAINLYGTCQNISVTNCEFNNIERHGISLAGTYTKVNISQNIFTRVYGSGIMSNNLSTSKIEYNFFTDIGMWQGYGAVFGFPINNNSGFAISGNNNHVHHNVVKNTGYNGIRVDGEGNLTENNLVQNACLKANDGGGIYFWGTGTKNSTFQYNVVDNVVGNLEGTPGGYIIASLYFDNGSNNITVENNVLVNSSHMGMLVNRGTQAQIIKNNLIHGFDQTGIVFANDITQTSSINNIASGNIISTTSTDAYFISKSTTNSTDNYDPGTFTGNTYFNPYNPVGFRSSKTGSGTIHRKLSLKAWQDLLNEDMTSNAIFLGWNLNEVTSEAGSNLVKNGTFDAGIQDWTKWTNGTSNMSYAAASSLDGGALRLQLTSSGASDITFAYNVLSAGLNQNQWYEIAFDIIGNKNGNTQVIPKRHYGSYNGFGADRTIPFFTTPKQYKYTFKASENISTARLDLQIGINDSEYTLDNVSLTPVNVEFKDPASRVKYFYNASDNSKNVTLPAGTWYKLDGTSVSGSISLAGWAGIVVYTTDAVVVSSNADLATLTSSAGTLTPAFDAATYSYTVKLPAGTTEVPTVSATPADAKASVDIVQATNLSGSESERTATVTVTAEDGTTIKTYQVIFEVELSANADLAALTSSQGVLSPVFQAGTTSYTINLPAGTNVIPSVSATAADPQAAVAITQAGNLTGTETQRTATVTVTAEDGTTIKTYTVVFFVLPEEGKDATLKLLTTGEGTLEPAFAPGIQSYAVKLPAGTLAVPQTTAEANDPNATLAITEATNLEGTLFERTTTITVTAADGVTQMVYTVVFDNESEVVQVILNPHNQFSPNGDLIDDLWVIENIEQVAAYEVIVFNRIGQQLFRTVGYQNNWDGTSNGKALHPATYYFVIRNEKGENVQSGSVNLIR